MKLESLNKPERIKCKQCDKSLTQEKIFKRPEERHENSAPTAAMAWRDTV